jgi:cysteine desulfurase
VTSTPVYLDNQSTTPCDPRVVEVMVPYFTEHFGNAASRTHAHGREARDATERARAALAAWIGASPKEVVFTSGATESDNLALLGAARARRADDGRAHLVTVATEHRAVLDPVAALAREGFTATVVPVASDGLVDRDTFAAALRPDTAVVSVMLANNEIGVLQPIRVLADAAHARGAWVHCDAAQAACLSIDVTALGVDLLSLSAHKVHGPKGVGALYVRRTRPRIRLEPLHYGGGHERGLRSGTLPVPLIVGFGRAAELAQETFPTEAPRVRELRDRLLDTVRVAVPDVLVNGSLVHRSPCNLNLSFPGVEAAALLLAIRADASLSTGSACSSESLEPSHVLRALGGHDDRAMTSIRLGLSRLTSEDDVDRVTRALSVQVPRLRGLGVLSGV